MLNRTIAPQGKPFKYIPLPTYTQTVLKNGVKVYWLPYGNVDVCEIQAIFRAGAGFETKTGISDMTPRNVSEGTRNHSSLSYARALDNFGAWVEYDAGTDFIAIVLTSLSHLCQKTVPLMAEAMVYPTFPEDAFEKMKKRAIEKLKTSNKKTAYVAQKNFFKLIFGECHAYGVTTDVEELKQMEREDLVQYHAQYLHAGNMCLTVTGKFNQTEIEAVLEENFGSLPTLPANTANSSAQASIQTADLGRYFFPQEGVQSTVFAGYPSINRFHEDAEKWEMTNVILGGYFGSRLMKNLREDKGYTYGVYSQAAMYNYSGVFYVRCDVGNEYVEDTFLQIKHEMRLLAEKGVTEEELQLVKNYNLGKSISGRETPFQMSRWLRHAIVNGISFAQLDKKFEIYAHLTTADIQTTAAKYLNPDALREVVCGGTVQ